MVIETVKLINTIKKMYPVTQFFKDRYFPDGKTYYSEKALIETRKGGRAAAPFVIPVVDGIVMDSQGYNAEMVEAPYIAPKMAITARELEQKAFGEAPDSGRSPAQRENEVQAEHMEELRSAILRRHEWMCTKIITDGCIRMKHYASAEDAAKDQNYQVRELRFFDRGGFGNRYSFEKDFASMRASEKIREFYKIAEKLRGRGIRATDIVMTADVSMLLMTDLEFLEFYNKADVRTGMIDQKDLPEGVVCNGNINVNGIVFTMFTYDEKFMDLDGKEKDFLPRGTIAFLKPGMGTTAYAQVTFIKNGSFVSYAEKIVPRIVADEKNNIIEVQMFSRPVPYPLDWEGWMVANIYTTDSNGMEADAGDTAGDGIADNPSGGGDGVEMKTETEINAMTRKADVIAYAKSIGLTGLSDTESLSNLKAAVIAYQQELE